MSPAKQTEIEETALPAPRQNPLLSGHEAAERELLDAFNSGRMSHAWLICGPRGIGKATLAYRFARFILSQPGGGGGLFAGDAPALSDGLDVTPESPVFRRVATGAHADLMTVERGYTDDSRRKLRTEIVVSDVRRIGPFLTKTPAEGGWRVVIVDGADDMNRNAMNAVLKVLEEPPKRSLLLLVCHNPGRLLPTVRSRCRRLTLQPLAPDVLGGLLTRLLPETSADDAALLARVCDGSIGRAVTLAEEGGLDLYRDLTGLLETLPEIDVGALHGFSDRLSRPGAENAFRTVGELLLVWLARAIRHAAAPAITDTALDDTPRATRLVRQGNLDRWLQVWEKITLLLARTESVNLDRKQVLLSAMTAIAGAARG